MRRNAFSMIELIFVIVVMGILAAIAIPKFAATRDDANIAKARSTIAAVRSAIINERQARLFRGQRTFISKLHNNTAVIFDHNGTTDNRLMMYGVKTSNSNGNWHSPACAGASPNQQCTYKFKLGGKDNTFTYYETNGTFVCTDGPKCSVLTD
jgi:general secretion pathway protein G